MNGRRSLTLLRIGGVEIVIDVTWILIFLLILWSLSAGYFPAEYPEHSALAYWITGLIGTLLFFTSVLVHELSHAFVANSLGQPVRRITLFAFGGMAHLSGEPESPGAEMKIAAVGPLTSLSLSLLFWLLASLMAAVWPAPLAVGALRYLAFINLALAIFNLLPGFPLDGGRLLRAWFWQRTGDLRAATARAANWGSGIAMGLMVFGGLEIFSGALIGGLWLILIGMFLRGAARAGYVGVALEQSLEGLSVRDSMVSDPVTIEPDVSVADAVEHYFLKHGYTAFPVARDGHVAGLVSLSGVQHCRPPERARHQVGEIMQPVEDRIRIRPTASLSEALRRMAENDVSRLLVTDNGHLEGLITRSMIARFVQVRAAIEEPDLSPDASFRAT
jgi:Zn-dependent protease/predicted transcriptional regulator